MAKKWAKAFYNSKEWRECREAYIKSVNGLCERCLEKGIIKPGYIVHHTVELTPENINNPEITLNWDLLEYCCKKCHDEEHFVERAKVTREGLKFNEAGELVEC
ncbi:HNH endonuclease [Sporohalobacter salinus]|uniref:HNH endonuclease n=1 Tax=Sporohalobacter salinus TaxID=1494606 RepID=UPI00195F7E66|nr:HNH endonuclease [Sporohalobacter salinus]MBM7624770.1 5-methylcytosine-specific restriction endonuclease McrA [Sporohalobacter salinus]